MRKNAAKNLTIKSTLLVMLLALSFPSVPRLYSDSVGKSDAILRNVCRGSVLRLRTFYSGATLLYSASGKLVEGGKPGPWTLDACVWMASANLDGRALRLAGKRIYFVADGKGSKLTPYLGRPISIEIETVPGPSVGAILEGVIAKVFIRNGQGLADFVPDYWKPFLRHPHLASHRFENILDGGGSYRLERWRRGSSNSTVFQPPPLYPVLHLAGATRTLVLRYTISHDGRVNTVVVVKPVGLGLEEKAVQTVKTWRFTPMSRATLLAPGIVRIKYHIGSGLPSTLP